MHGHAHQVRRRSHQEDGQGGRRIDQQVQHREHAPADGPALDAAPDAGAPGLVASDLVHDPEGVELLVVVGIAWLAAALPPAMLMSYMELGWWLGHAWELIGIGLVAVPVAASSCSTR